MCQFKNRNDRKAQQAREDCVHQSLRAERLEPKEVGKADCNEQPGVDYYPHHRRKIVSAIEIAQAERIAELGQLVKTVVHQYLLARIIFGPVM